MQMTTLHFLESLTGEQWTGIQFHFLPVFGVTPRDTPVRLCEAIAESFRETFTLSTDFIRCPGACRSLGLAPSDMDELAGRMYLKTGTPSELARGIIARVPRLHFAPTAVTLGKMDSPDVVLSFLKPDAAMKMVRRWQGMYGTDLETTVSSFMAICGSVVVKAYNGGQPALSFGCPDSRQYGEMGDERLVLGMPYASAERLVEEGEVHANV